MTGPAWDLTIPLLHLSHASLQHVLAPLRMAGHAMREAEDAFARTVPRKSDYADRGAEAFANADAQHKARLRRVVKICEELAEMRRGLTQQVTVSRPWPAKEDGTQG